MGCQSRGENAQKGQDRSVTTGLRRGALLFFPFEALEQHLGLLAGGLNSGKGERRREVEFALGGSLGRSSAPFTYKSELC